MHDRFLRACRGELVDCTPVWFMRQAGRYMSEYRALREKHSLLELCRTPELAAEVTLQPLRALPVDAAILFADILLPLEPMGAPFSFEAGEGPVVHTPVRSRAQVDALRIADPHEGLGFSLETLKILRTELSGKTPVIGFAGAPFTLASYLVEGGKSSQFTKIKTLMFREPETFNALMHKLSVTVRNFLIAQINAGAQAVQLFDSWVGALAPEDYRDFVLPHVTPIFAALRDLGVPLIHFGTGTSTLLELQRDAGATVVGVDWRTPLAQARQRLGDTPVQGNLDPLSLLAPREVLFSRAKAVLEANNGQTGHVFNLGHGIIPETSVDAVKALTDFVHESSTVATVATVAGDTRDNGAVT